ncbi:MAG: hypothetical protein K0R00_222 [Herbinix sp.]|jgi:hypothetical protein|nr:hypothetical protein [Herbinix sp.]
MTQNLESVLSFLLRPAVEYNLPQKKYWGTVVKENSMLVASGSFTIEIGNIHFDKKPDGEYFSFLESKFAEFAYPLNPAQIQEKVSSQCSFVGKVVFPLTNIINRLSDIDKQLVPNGKDSILKRCRLIVSPGFLESGDMTLKFTDNGNGWEFKHASLPKPVRLHKDSVIGPDGIRKDTVYRCELKDSDDLLVNVIEPYGKMRLGILYSPKGFVPVNLEEINRMSGKIPPDMIICSNIIEPNPIPAPPIHLDASTMFDLLNVFLMCQNTEKIEMHLPDDPNKPVMFTNVPTSDDDLRIRVVVGTLNPFYGAQRR